MQNLQPRFPIGVARAVGARQARQVAGLEELMRILEGRIREARWEGFEPPAT